MGLMKQIITLFTALLLLALMSFFVFKVYTYAKSYEEMSELIVQKHNITQLSQNQLKKIAQGLTFGLYDGYELSLKEQHKAQEVQEFFKQKAEKYMLYFVATLGGLSLFYFILSLREFTILMALSGCIALIGGLVTPIMMLSIHKEVEYLGDVVLSMESKGVMGSILKLFENNDYVIGAVLLLFSVIFPLLKTIAILFVSLFIHSRFAHNLVHFFKVLGKWSMADVFVVSTLLVYFSASKGEMSRAEVQMGLYLFLSYVILSIFASILADTLLQKSKNI